MTPEFTQILIFALTAAVFGVTLLSLSLVMQKLFLIGTARPIKAQPYECGVKQIGKSIIQFDIKYYLFALLFIVFDLEFVFLLPWALYFAQAGTMNGQIYFLLLEAFIFVLILGLGWYYAYKTKALEWQ